MVAPEYHTRRGQTDPFGEFPDELGELGRGHPDVAAELVDLVGGRLYADDRVVGLGLLHASFEHVTVGGAKRVDPDRIARFVRPNRFQEKFGDCAATRRQPSHTFHNATLRT